MRHCFSRSFAPLLIAGLLLAAGGVPAHAAAAEAPAPSELPQLADQAGLPSSAIPAALPLASLTIPTDGVVSSATFSAEEKASPETLKAATTSDATAYRGSGRIAIPLGFGFFAIGMVALTKDRNAPKRSGDLLPYPVGAAKRIYAGAIVVANGGYAEPGTTALNLVALGRAVEQVDNTAGAAGALTVRVERGVFLFANDGTITAADIGKKAWIVDDQTVSDLDRPGAEPAATRSQAGTIRGVEAGGAWVEI